MSEVEVDGRPDKWGSPELGTPSGTLTWYADLTGLDISGSGSVDDFHAELTEAFTAWEDSAAVSFVEATGPSANIFISVERLEEVSPDTLNIENAAGLASRWLNPGTEVDRITSVDIWFDEDRDWSLDGNFFRVAAHEIGHGIGLNHIHDPTQVMNPTVRVDALGASDIAAAQELYGSGDGGSGPDTTPTPPPVSGDETGDDGGGGGGAAALLLGLLAGIVAFLFGGPGGAAAVVAAGRISSEDDEELPEFDEDDLLPGLMVDQHATFLGEDGLMHEIGCGCSCCSGEDQLLDELVI